MSLIDRLREAALPPSHDPTGGELAQIVGRLIAFVEHGEKFLEAAKRDAELRDAGEEAHEVDRLLSPESFEEQDQAAAAQPSSPAAPAAPDDKDAEIASLREQLAIAQANAQRTEATVEPGPPAGGASTGGPEDGGHA